MDINSQKLELYSKLFNTSEKNKLARNAVTSSKLSNILLNREKAQKHNRIFSNEIKVKTLPSEQKFSGRCWLFAACNMMRLKMNAKYGFDDFEFSQSYLAFYDKLERSNFFLSTIIKYRNEHANSRINDIFLKEPISDGGNWNMILNLVNKYGLIPKSCFNETEHSNNTSSIDDFLSNKLRDYAYLIRNLTSKEFKNIDIYLNKFMAEIYKMLVIFMGEPPKTFDWEFLNKGKYTILKDLTPQEFYKKHVLRETNDLM